MLNKKRSWMSLIVVMFVVAGCSGINVTRGSGNVISQTREVSNFSAVQFSGFGSLAIEQNGQEALTIEAEDNLVPLIKTSVVDGTLRIETENGTAILPTKDLKFKLSVKSLTSIKFSGAGDITASNLNGSSVSVDLSGAGKLTLSGTVTSQTVVISGAGSYDGSNLDSKNAVINDSGAGNATVKVSDTLSVNISGAGRVEYIGNPTITKSISGLGAVQQKQ
ncbi:MAG TPA: head GIN domain-containing protein [Aggregatilineales bacterium]|nr:head GIN domain-containing protein [Aggregatilineales bacterium]